MARSVDIFVTYRRGAADTPNAGRIHDFVLALGYEGYYDYSERANPTGEQYAASIQAALSTCRVIIAVIGPSWIEQIPRLKDDDDWVRRELLAADPQHKRVFLPVYIGTCVEQLSGQLPPELAFIAGTQSHFKWDRFEHQEKAALKERLEKEFLPVQNRSDASDSPHLEFLCDRIRAETGFRSLLRTSTISSASNGWLLFGEANEAHFAMFDRIKEFTLKQSSISTKYPRTAAIKLDFEENYGSGRQFLERHIFDMAADGLGTEEMGSYQDLQDKLVDKHVSLLLFYSLVTARDRKQAQWWEKRFSELLEASPRAAPGKPCILLALAIAYETKKPAWWRLLPADDTSAAGFFAERFPRHFSADEFSPDPAAPNPDPFVATRLLPVKRSDVENWCNNLLVKRYVKDCDDLALEPFADDDAQLPMDAVINHLRGVLNARNASSPGKGALSE